MLQKELVELFFFFIFSCSFGSFPRELDFVEKKFAKLLLALRKTQQLFFATLHYFPTKLVLTLSLHIFIT
jgi:hypothetical protein